MGNRIRCQGCGIALVMRADGRWERSCGCGGGALSKSEAKRLTVQQGAPVDMQVSDEAISAMSELVGKRAGSGLLSFAPDPDHESEHEYMLADDGTTPAPAGQVWVCTACGKRSRTRYGFDDDNQDAFIDRGWDESCSMHAVLCYEQRGADGAWRAVEGQ